MERNSPAAHTAHAGAGGSWVEEGGMFGSFARKTTVAVVAVSVAVSVCATTAYAEAEKCKAGIIKANAAFVQAKAKALAKCEEAVVKGKLPAGDCHADAKA